MTRITRKTLNIFAGSATNNGQFGSAQGSSPLTSTDPAVIQNFSSGASWAAGWVDAVIGGQKLPPLEEFQGVQYVHSYELAYLFQEGIPEYDSGTTYYQYSIVKDPSTFILYGSTFAGANTGNALTNATYWTKLVDLSNVPGIEAASGTTTNVSNAYSVTTTPAVTTLATGQIFNLQINAANTGAATLNVGGSGAVAIVDRTGNALVGGEFVANRTYPFVYNGTNFTSLVSYFPDSSYGTTTNVSNAYSVTTTPAFNGLRQGQILTVVFNAGNTGAVTLNPNSIGAKAVVDVNGNALGSGAITANRNYILVYTGTQFIALGTQQSFVSVKMQVFTSSGTYTPSTGMLYAECITIAGGGGGGGANGTNANAGGGGSGNTALSIFSASTIGASQTITIGGSGTAGSTSGGTGGTGGNSSIGSLVTANGGVGGGGSTSATSGAGGAGGTNSGTVTTSFTFAGGTGTDSGTAAGGAGANTPYGQGGQTTVAGSVTGANGQGYGAGGAGATGTSRAGGSGAPGIVIIREFCSQ